jgi:hypothetical protein
MTTIVNFYNAECDNCHKARPDKSIPVFYDKGQGLDRPHFWCFDCIKKELHKELAEH